MSAYQTLLHQLAPDLNPAGVEASMRMQYFTLNQLDIATFAAETKIAAHCEGLCPGILRHIAAHMGFADDFAKWEAMSHVA